MSRDVEILRHALGLDRYGRGVQYRNYFVTGPGSKDWDDCQRLTEIGLMIDRGAMQMYGGDHVFAVTDAGVEYVRRASPRPPQLTRGQRRYRAFLAADSELSFGEWLRAGREGEG